MWLAKAAKFLNKLNRPIVNWLKNIAMIILAAMMFLTATDVILRYIFNRPVTGAYELIEFMMAVLISFGLGYCAIEAGHVSVDLVVSHLSKRRQAIIGAITSLLSATLFLLITWQNVLFIKEYFESKLESAVLHIPVYPFIGAVAIGSAALFLVLIMDLFNSLSEVVTK
jgi:TRAP-type C4-dicarboxylate transport system permease small subunit